MPIRTVLVIDDSPTDRHFIAELLVAGGYEVQTAESAEEAYVRIRERRPDLVLMDIVMPGENGFEATRELQRGDDTRDIPIIICTSKRQPSDRVWGMRQGAREFIVKPIRRQELLAKIAALG
ncbi:MAG: response regulator [Burkholderiales bacterium]|nr:response regulator [Burkholderiales bacterium]